MWPGVIIAMKIEPKFEHFYLWYRRYTQRLLTINVIAQTALTLSDLSRVGTYLVSMDIYSLKRGKTMLV